MAVFRLQQQSATADCDQAQAWVALSGSPAEHHCDPGCICIASVGGTPTFYLLLFDKLAKMNCSSYFPMERRWARGEGWRVSSV